MNESKNLGRNPVRKNEPNTQKDATGIFRSFMIYLFMSIAMSVSTILQRDFVNPYFFHFPNVTVRLDFQTIRGRSPSNLYVWYVIVRKKSKAQSQEEQKVRVHI